LIGRLFRQSTCMPVFFLYIRDAIYIRPPTHDLKQTHYVLQYMPFMFPVLFHHCNDINRPQSLLFWLWFVPETAISYEYLMQTTTFLQSYVTVCTFNAPDDDDQNTKHHIICQWTQKQIMIFSCILLMCFIDSQHAVHKCTKRIMLLMFPNKNHLNPFCNTNLKKRNWQLYETILPFIYLTFVLNSNVSIRTKICNTFCTGVNVTEKETKRIKNIFRLCSTSIYVMLCYVSFKSLGLYAIFCWR